MKLTKENFNNDEVFGLFDEETDLLTAVEKAIEHLKDSE